MRYSYNEEIGKQSVFDKKRRNIALIIETSNEYARGLLRGIRSYIREGRSWSIYLIEHSRNSTDLSWLNQWKGDGIIARIENDRIARFIQETGLPAVDLSAFRFLPDLPCVETDDQAIARLAANHLLERGFKHFGYVGDSRFNWSRWRGEHFVRHIEEAGYRCSVFDSYADIAPGRSSSQANEQQAIVSWLNTLPKPIGLLACYDKQGQQLLEACRAADIAVPDDAGVIGVDNDDLLCELSNPPLSSIAPDTLRTGYFAASLLDRMMAGQTVSSKMYLIEPTGVHTRQSTDVLAIEDKIVSDAIRFIRGNANYDINVSDLLKAIPVSRRVLESRFLKVLGHTPHDEIIRVKMKIAKQLLAETDLTLPDIAERSGFKHPEYLSVVFKKITGQPPSAYRSQNQRLQ